MISTYRKLRSMALVGLLLAGAGALGAQGTLNTLTAAQKKEGWRLLFDGKTTAGFRGYKTDTVPAAWHVVDGVLTKTVGTGDIVTKEQFQDFALQWDWKLGNAGNSGVFYRASEEYDHIYWTGPEFQLLDDANAPDGRNRLTSAGSAYGLYAAPAGIVKAADQWNTSQIIVKGKHVEHWMNGQKLLEYELGSPDWEAKVKASKFGVWPHYGRVPKGVIGFQGDHNGTLSLRNIMIRELK
jgi:hypothetical protein